MQFALLVYESPEAFAARNSDGTDPPTPVLGGRTIRLSSNPAPTSLAILLKCTSCMYVLSFALLSAKGD